jgi:nitroreductase
MPQETPQFFSGLVESRVSIRRFLPTPVERDEILHCLEAARLAPSSENRQPWRFLILDEPEVREPFAKEVFSGVYRVTRFAAEAPVLIILLARLNFITHRLGRRVQKVPFHLIDLGIAGEHLVLQAEELGLGSCWIGWFDVRKARKLLRIPRDLSIVSMLAMGYYEKNPSRPRKRKPIEEIAFFNSLSEGGG